MRAMRAAAAAAILVGCISFPGLAYADPEPPPEPPPPGAKTSIDADGTYAVGTDIEPGVYSSAGPIGGGACYWKRVSGGTIVDNAMTKKPQVVQIQASDTSFTTNECQAWQKTDGPPPAQPGPQDLLGQLGQLILKAPSAPPPG